MKKYFLLFSTLLIVFWGCNKQDGILEPSQSSKLAETVKMDDSQNLQLISLPVNLKKSSGILASLLKVERISELKLILKFRPVLLLELRI